MPGVTVDGMDVFAVWEAATAAVKRARAGEGPSMIECKTYRYYGHYSADNPHNYRTVAEEDEARTHDPIKRFREKTIAEQIFTAADLDEIDARNKALLDEAVKFAEASPLPVAADLMTEVYSND